MLGRPAVIALLIEGQPISGIAGFAQDYVIVNEGNRAGVERSKRLDNPVA
jgi:hypothetical protein